MDSRRKFNSPFTRSKLSLLAMVAVAGAMPLASPPAHADELSDLKAQMQVLNKRLESLETSKNAAPAAAPVAVPEQPSAALSTDINGKPKSADSSALMLYNKGDSSISMYGLVEATVSHANNQNAQSATATGFQVAYFSGNRLGFDIQHGIGAFGSQFGMPDLKVISRLETEFELPTGQFDTPGYLFNRDAWVGLYSKSLGKLTFGRQNTLTRDFTNNWGDPYGGAYTTPNEGGYSNNNNFKQFIFYSAGPNGTRYNSAIEWKKEFDSHLLGGLAYSFGSGGNGASSPGGGGSVPGNFTEGTGQAASLAYQRINLGSAILNTNINYDRANTDNLIHQAFLVGGNVVMGNWRVNAGKVHYTAQQGLNNSMGNRVDNSWTTSLQYKPNKFEYDVGYQVMKGTNAGFSAGGTTLNPFFGNTSGVTSTANGQKRSIYGAVRYNIDKHTDIYFAADYFKVSGGWVVGDSLGNGQLYGADQAQRSEMEYAMGLRFKF